MRTHLFFGLVSVALVLPATAIAVEGEKAKHEGYAEYRKGDLLIVDGQRVFADAKTEFKGKGIRNLNSIPMGFEVKVEGRRQRDGSIRASKIEAKPNGIALYEAEVLNATNQIERTWVSEGVMYMEGRRGERKIIGKIVETGPEAERVRRIMDDLRPPYVNAEDIRVHVVDTKEWNASAMGNGAIWVYSGLIEEMSDDELAIILGHELAHYTHEHSRRGAKKSMWGQIVGLGALIGAGTIDNAAGRTAASLGAMLSMSAWQTGYSRDLEDQADRVGLRYAYEGGYDVTQGPELWAKFREKYGESGSLQTFFFGSHSRPSDRIQNIDRELNLNYTDTLN